MEALQIRNSSLRAERVRGVANPFMETPNAQRPNPFSSGHAPSLAHGVQWDLVDPWHSLGMSLEKHKAILQRKGLSFIRMAGTPIPRRFRMDRKKLASILNAFLSNACQFTSKGFVLLNAFLRPDPLVWRLVFEVRDSGKGLSASEVQRINLGLYPLEHLQPQQRGLGRSQMFARLLGCTVACESVFGQGSAFRLEVPMDPAELRNLHQPNHESGSYPAKPNPGVPQSSTPSFEGRVLVVDDNPDTLTILRYHFRKLGLQVELAFDGNQALEKSGQQDFQIIYMDMQMPGMDGATATRHLRTRGFVKPIIGLTASTAKGEAEAFLEAGCNACLTKPVAVDQLAKTLSQWLHQPQKASPMTLKSLYADDPDILPLIKAYLVSLDGMVHELRTALGSQCFAEAASIAHKIKGSGGMYGYPSITEAALALEKTFLEGQPASLESLVNLIERAKGDPSLQEGG